MYLTSKEEKKYNIIKFKTDFYIAPIYFTITVKVVIHFYNVSQIIAVN